MTTSQKLGRDIPLCATVERYDVVDGGGGAPLDVLKARMSFTQSGQHVEYTVRVHLDEKKSWILRKRFNEVASLHEVLKKRLATFPELPPKSAVRQFSPEYLEGRKAGLNAYLQALCARRDALNCPEVQEFFGLPDHVAEFQQPCANEPFQVAEVHESAFGIKDFAFNAEQGLLLLGATDGSWTSRMDTKITNIKLPWEPAAPNLPTSQMCLWKQAMPSLRFEMQFTCRYTAAISCVAFCESGDRALCLCGLGDGTVGYHQTKGERGISSAGATLPLLRHTGGVAALAVDNAEQWIISASKDKGIMVYDMRRQMIQCEVQTPAPTYRMYYCEQQKRLFTGLANGRVIVWNTSIFPIQQLATIPDGADPLPGRICSMDFDIKSGTLFTSVKDGFTLWAVKSSQVGAWGRRMGHIPSVAGEAKGIAWMPGSRELLVALPGGSILIFDVEAGEGGFAFQAHKDEITSTLWLEDARRLLTASKDKTLKIWDFPLQGRELPADRIHRTQYDVSSVPGSAGAASTASRAGSFFGGRPSVGSGDPLGASTTAPALAPVSGGPPGRGAFPPPLHAAVPAAAVEVPKGAASTALANDSDDDLAGWDS